jgi:predicted FMN-binding regulatory protein PaiB
VIAHEYYTTVPADEVARFVQAQELGRLVTVGADGMPHVGLYPFVHDGEGLELHLVLEDELVADLKARPRCAFEVDEVLATIPSYWVHAEYAGVATAYHRTVVLECVAAVIEDPAVVMAQQERLLARYQPEGGYRSLQVDDPMYRGALGRLAAVRLTVQRVRPHFKLGQNRPAETRRAIIERLRTRGRAGDARAAAALEWTLDDGPEVAPPPRP